MISHTDIERLARLKSDHGILTAYIRIDPRLRFVRQQAVSQFKGALKEAQRRVQDERWREVIERESPQVLQFLTNREPPGRGLVIFSCRPERLWEVVTLDVMVPNLVDVDTTTKTGILVETLRESPRLIVAVLQRDKARLYIAEQGVSEQQVQVATEVPGQHEQGGRSQMRFQRHIDFHFAEHLKAVIDELKKLAERQPFKLALGGTEETVNELLERLPDFIMRRVIGRFPVDHKHDTEEEMLQRAEHLWRDHERLEENKLLDLVFDAARSGQRAVLGIEATLNALTEEKVQTLLFVDGLAIDGSVCTRCDYFSASRFETCPLCSGEAEQKDISDRAVEKAIRTSADAELVSSGEGRARLLAEGGLGALLRY